MKESQLGSDERHELRRKAVYWGVIIAGIAAIVIGVVGIAILAVIGLFLLAMSIGSVLLGKHLLRLAKNQPQWYPFNMGKSDRK